jgi:Uri superfamily endonuclease
MTGVYLILVELTEAAEIQVRSGRRFRLETGFYGYVGSALSGLEKRIARHLGNRKKLYWHIDYLLHRAVVRMAISAETSRKEECFIAHALSQRLPVIPGFGSSDCRCPSHLFFSQDLPTIKRDVLALLKQRNLKPIINT